METRRDSLKIIGAIGATCAFPFSADELYGQHVHEAAKTAPLAPAGPFTPQFFTAPEIETISRISDLIIPPTDTPGAVAAGVPQYIDTLVHANPEYQKVYREGLAHMDAVAKEKFSKPFVQLTEAEQIEMLTPLSEGGDAFFTTVKSMTADGYYTSQIGLVQELGYKGNTALAAFPECTHEH